MCWLCVVGGSNEGARPGVSVFREAVGSLGWTESGSRTISRTNPKSRTVKKVPTFPESTSSRLRKVRLSARADAGGPAVARTGRIVAEAGHGGKDKKRAAGRTAESVPTLPETAAARDSENILARRGGVLRAEFAKTCSGAAKPPQTKLRGLRGLRVRIEPAAGSAFSALSA